MDTDIHLRVLSGVGNGGGGGGGGGVCVHYADRDFDKNHIPIAFRMLTL